MTVLTKTKTMSGSRSVLNVLRWIARVALMTIHTWSTITLRVARGAFAGALVMTGFFLYSANPATIEFADFLILLHTDHFFYALMIGALIWVLAELPVGNSCSRS